MKSGRRTCLDAVDSEREPSEGSDVVISEHCVEVDLLNAVDVACKQRRDLLTGTIGCLHHHTFTDPTRKLSVSITSITV